MEEERECLTTSDWNRGTPHSLFFSSPSCSDTWSTGQTDLIEWKKRGWRGCTWLWGKGKRTSVSLSLSLSLCFYTDTLLFFFPLSWWCTQVPNTAEGVVTLVVAVHGKFNLKVWLLTKRDFFFSTSLLVSAASSIPCRAEMLRLRMLSGRTAGKEKCQDCLSGESCGEAKMPDLSDCCRKIRKITVELRLK